MHASPVPLVWWTGHTCGISALSCSFGLVWLINHGWKYYWLIWYERKILFIDWKSMTYKTNKPKRMWRISTCQELNLSMFYHFLVAAAACLGIMTWTIQGSSVTWTMINSPHEQLAGIAITRVIKLQPRAKIGFLSDAACLAGRSSKSQNRGAPPVKIQGGLGLGLCWLLKTTNRSIHEWACAWERLS